MHTQPFCLILMTRLPPTATLFPYTTLFRSVTPVLFAPRLQNLLGVFDDSFSIQGNIQEHNTTSCSLLRRRPGDTGSPPRGCRNTPPGLSPTPRRPMLPSAHQRAASRTSPRRPL